MTDTDIIHIGTLALKVTAELSAPLLIASLVVGIVVSLFQTIFQIQDQTLSAVPRLAVCAGVVLLAGSWMLRTLVEFTQQLFAQIPQLLS
ncbi:MAG: fliQ [Mycobacterium sp.]|jgi:flagellar biosynthetic protein FliQ|nr:fliQ [Mycobacterium sp.]MCW2744653.1 fliQ [Mycobacterium sp.]